MTSKNEIELYHIYSVLRRLRSLKQTDIGRLINNEKLFPRRFVLKLLDDKLSESKRLAIKFVIALFKRLSGQQKSSTINTEASTSKPRRTKTVASTALAGAAELANKSNEQEDKGSQVSSFSELDEYFHSVLNNLHDFLIDLNWHEPILEDDLSKKDERYVLRQLKHLHEFIQFRAMLLPDRKLIKRETEKSSSKLAIKSDQVLSKPSYLSSKAVKSSLTSNSDRLPESPGLKRRVRFSNINLESSDIDIDTDRGNTKLDKDIQDSTSILALDLLIFALHVFSEQLMRSLIDWSESSVIELKDSINLIKTSKKKLRVNRLIGIASDCQISNIIYSQILAHLDSMERFYLLNNILDIVCAQDDDRIVEMYKQPRIRSFINGFIRENEKISLNQLSLRVLHVMIELLTCEINMPPVELNTGTKDRTRRDVGKSQDNYLNFITSWLNLDELLFGQKRTGSKTKLIDKKKKSLLSPKVDCNFKSSSRILNQMDNLTELLRLIMVDLMDFIPVKRQREYFLQLLYSGLVYCLELIWRQLQIQLPSIRRKLSKARNEDLNDTELSIDVDATAYKIRCLKFIHITSTIDGMMKDIARDAKIELYGLDMSDKLAELISQSTSLLKSI